MVQQNITKLASIATRSTAARTANPRSSSDQIHSHPDVGSWGGRALAAAVALHSREVLAGAPVMCSTVSVSEADSNRSGSESEAVMGLLRDRIRSISQDMHALNRSCCDEMAASSSPHASRRVAVRLRASHDTVATDRAEKEGLQKRARSDTNEEV